MRRSLFLTLSAALLFPVAAAARDAEHAFQSAVARGSVQRVTIDVPFGTFVVRNGEASRLALSGVASRDYDGERERVWAEKVVADSSVEFYVNGTEAVVRRRFGPNADSWRARKFTGYDLRLDLPAGVDVVFETSAGDIDIAGDFGDVDIDLRAGEIDLRIPRKQVRELRASCRIGEVKTHLGNEIVTREGVLPGRTRYFNPAGRSRINVHTTVGEVDIVLTQ